MRISSRSYHRGSDGVVVSTPRFDIRRRLVGFWWVVAMLVSAIFPTIDAEAGPPPAALVGASEICPENPALGYIEFENANDYLLCSGTVIDNGGWLLTAAHCARDYTEPSAVITYGWGSSAAQPDGTRTVTEVYFHPEWTGGGSQVADYTRDIALLRLNSALTNVQPYTLGLPPPVGADVNLASYGSTAGPANDYGILRCGTTTITEALPSGQIGFEYNRSTGDVGACKGDSGAGLVTGARELLAVTSVHDASGLRTCRNGVTYAVTLTDDVVEWIDGVILVAERGLYGGNP